MKIFAIKNYVFLFLAFGALGLVYACGAAMRVGVPGLVFGDIQAGLGWTASETAFISSVGIIGCMITLPFAGLAIDRLSWRRVFLVGVLLQVGGGVLMAHSFSRFLIYAGAWLNGCGRTIIYLAIMNLLATEFRAQFFSILIGVFYVFSYGGTLSSSEIFANSSAWRTIVRELNFATFLFGLFAFACLPFLAKIFAKTDRDENGTPEKFAKTENLAKTKKFANFKSSVRVFSNSKVCFAIFCPIFAIAFYWAFLLVGAKIYLKNFYGGSLRPLDVMNIIVMLEMIFGGSLSYLFGNHRRVFQVAALGFMGFGLLCLPFGFIGSGIVWAAFLSIGIGYGLTSVLLCAVRDAVPREFTARAIALVNFFANIGIILLSQLVGLLYDML